MAGNPPLNGQRPAAVDEKYQNDEQPHAGGQTLQRIKHGLEACRRPEGTASAAKRPLPVTT